VNNRLNHK